MDVTDFNKNYFNGLLNKTSKEKNHIFFFGDFNINLINYIEHRPTIDFLESLSFSSLLPYILPPTRLNGYSNALIENIFCHLTSHDVISINIIATVSDHLPQFVIVPDVFANPSLYSINYCSNYFVAYDFLNFLGSMFNSKTIKVCYIITIYMQNYPMTFY